MSQTDSIISLQGLEKTYSDDLLRPTYKALKGLDYDFTTAHTTAILGVNGAGKTTLLRSILGLVRCEHGKILFEGQPLEPRHRQHIGYMPETTKLPPQLSAFEILSLSLRLYEPNLASSHIKERVTESLEQVALRSSHHHLSIDKLSKGMNRRIAWALATIHKPKLLILDEPFTGLDPGGRDKLGQWLSEWNQNGGSALMSTHELDWACRLCSHFIVLQEGKIIYQQNQKSDPAEFIPFFKE